MRTGARGRCTRALSRGFDRWMRTPRLNRTTANSFSTSGSVGATTGGHRISRQSGGRGLGHLARYHEVSPALRRNPQTGRRDYRERLDGRPTESALRTVGYPYSCTLRSGMSAGDPSDVASSIAAPDGKGLASLWIDAHATSRASGIRISGRPRLSSWSAGEDGRGAFGSLTWGLVVGVPQSGAKASTNHQCGLK